MLLAVCIPTPAPATTEKHIAVLLINFTGDSRQPWTTSFIDSLYDGTGKSVKNFWNDSTWGEIQISADVYGWFTIAEPVTPCHQDTWQAQADAAATAAGVNLSAYTNKAYIWPQNDTPGACRSGGEMPGDQSWIALQTTCTPSACAARSALIHEFGHNLGLNHAGDVNGEYGDSFSVMGCCTTAQVPNVQRLQAGWIPPSQVQTVTTSGPVTVTAATNQSSLVYRIPDGMGNYIYLENRAIRTTWENGTGSTWTGGKLLLRIAPDFTTAAITTLLDLDPVTSPQAVGLPVGSTYTMTNGTTITNQAFDGSNNTVQIEVSC